MKNIVFIGNARCYHTLDWYRSAIGLLYPQKIPFLTDLIESEGHLKLVNSNDQIVNLFNIDKWLLKKQSGFGNLWRNFIKLFFFPLQVIKVKQYAKKNQDILFQAHTMYYIFVCWKARVPFGGTPQGSEILVRPSRSKLYKYFAIKSLLAAEFITVDSLNMKNQIFEMCGKDSTIVQNGIDVTAIMQLNNISSIRDKIVSIRGFHPLYRIDKIFNGRLSCIHIPPIIMVYPYWEDVYKAETAIFFRNEDIDLGRLTRAALYELLSTTKLAISIPESDSSPRSVYEAIFCGCCVAVTYNPYLDSLPDCMKERIFIVDLNDQDWFQKAIDHSEVIVKKNYEPSAKALQMFDQKKSIQKVAELFYK